MNWVRKRYRDADYIFAGRAYSEVTCSCGCNGFYLGFDGDEFVAVCRDCKDKVMIEKELIYKQKEAGKK